MSDFVVDIKNLSISAGSNSLVCSSDFNVRFGEIVGLFGDSGSGKSVFSLFLLGLLNRSVFKCSADRAFVFKKQKKPFFNLLNKKKSDWNDFRLRFISLVFQDPATSLNPVLTCGQQLSEVFYLLKKGNLKKNCLVVLKEVGIANPEKVFNSFPHELSGGQKQRVVIAIALASEPVLLIADEPTTSLDPSVQKEVLDLILSLKKTRNLSVVLISHNLDLINFYSDRVIVFKDRFFVENKPNKPMEHLVSLNKILKKIREKKIDTSFSLSNFNLNNSLLLKKLKLFDLKNVSLSYVKNNKKFTALKNINLKISGGDCLGIVGGSGSGKTTLGRILCGIEKNYSGDFYYNDSVFSLLSSVQMVYQDPFLTFNPKYTVGDSVNEIIKLYKTNTSDKELFKFVSLDTSLINRFPHELSGGQKQRVSIARVLASNPKIIVFDESISALDIETQFSILNLIYFINKKLNITVIFISHDINSIYYLCDKIIVLKKGLIIDSFKTKNLFSNNRKYYTKLLISDSNFKKNV